jgi:hypothetical protein
MDIIGSTKPASALRISDAEQRLYMHTNTWSMKLDCAALHMHFASVGEQPLPEMHVLTQLEKGLDSACPTRAARTMPVAAITAVRSRIERTMASEVGV